MLGKSAFVTRLLCGVAFASVVSLAHEVLPLNPEEKILIDADTLKYDQHQKTILARGHVTLAQGAKVLEAEDIEYSKLTNMLTAKGPILLLEEHGHVIAGDSALLERRLTEGYVSRPRMLLPDDARLVAVRGERFKGAKTVLTQVMYSPCSLCTQDPRKPPLWSLRANRVEQKGEKHHIEYYDTKLYLYNTPILYTPYLRHPDPSIRRLSGFLTPVTSFSSRYGVYVSTPYYWDIAPSQDMTITPHFMTRYGPLLGTNYRRHMGKGIVTVDSSGGNVKRISGTNDRPIDHGIEPRWHVDAKARFDATNHWRWGADWQRTSDETYLKNFRFFKLETKSSLNSRVFTEGFYDRHYALLSTYWFQGLGNQYDVNETPKALPEVDLAFSGQPKESGGGHWFWNFNSLSLYRFSRTKVQRAITVLGWKREMVSPLGDIYTLTTSMRGDLYNVRNFDLRDPSYVPLPGTQVPVGQGKINQLVGRSLPQVALDWRYPWYKPFGHEQVVTVQPIVGLVGAPDVKFKRQIPNEDSRLFDFDDGNLYSLNRFSGYDLLDSGSRLNYGAQGDWQHVNGGQAVVFLGQSYTMSKQEMELGEVGFAHRHSDYVGRIDLSPHPIVDLKYKFRLDRSDMKIRRSDLGLSTGTEVFRVKADYFYFQDTIGTGDLKNREQIQLELVGQVTEEWSAKTHLIRDLGLDKPLEHRVMAEYKNECLTVTTGFFHTFYQDAEVKSDKGLFLKVTLKNLGM